MRRSSILEHFPAEFPEVWTLKGLTRYEAARAIRAEGTDPSSEGWGGWLGRYQSALVEMYYSRT
ncbi:MAG: hypothetical protein ACR2JB_04270 [Bryobacteraceae bacterium]